MRLKTEFWFFCLTLFLVFCFGLSNSYSEDCRSYLKDYLNKLSDFESAKDYLSNYHQVLLHGRKPLFKSKPFPPKPLQ